LYRTSTGAWVQQGTGYGEPLSLATQASTVLADLGVVAGGKLADELVRPGDEGGVLQFLARGIGCAEAQVVGDRAGEAVDLLRDDADGVGSVKSSSFTVDLRC
jgi:hypothetical protein